MSQHDQNKIPCEPWNLINQGNVEGFSQFIPMNGL